MRLKTKHLLPPNFVVKDISFYSRNLNYLLNDEGHDKQ